MFYELSNDADIDQREENIKLGKRSPQFGGTQVDDIDTIER